MSPLSSNLRPSDRSCKSRVLRAASKLFSMHGFSGTSVRQIASRARVNEVTIFRLFSTKRVLYEHVLKSNLAKALRSEPTANGPEEQDQILHSLANQLQQVFDPELTRLLIFAALEEPRTLRKWITPRMEECYALVERHLEKLMALGAIRGTNSRLMAEALVALILYERISNAVLTDPPASSKKPGNRTESLVEIWLHGVAEQMSFQ